MGFGQSVPPPPTSEERRYWADKDAREREDQTRSIEFWSEVPSVLTRVAGFLVALVLLVLIFYFIMWLKDKYDEQQAVLSRGVHEHTMQRERFHHEDSMQDKKLRQEQALKLEEIKLNEKRLQQEQYNSERKFRLEMGKLCMDMYKEAEKQGEHIDYPSLMATMTRTMLMADQPPSSMEAIAATPFVAVYPQYNHATNFSPASSPPVGSSYTPPPFRPSTTSSDASWDAVSVQV